MYAFMLILFFLSGIAGLLYEVLWTRLFGLMLGNTTLAVSCVLAAFFTGLALGGRFFGRHADTHPHPLRLFAQLEIALAISALFILLVQPLIRTFFVWTHPHLVMHPELYYLIRFVLSFMVMVPATFFMGGTLPVMSRAFIRGQKAHASRLGFLYGINTFGAMCGCLAAAFVILRLYGLQTGFATAIGLDVLIAVAAWTLSRNETSAIQTISNKQRPLFSREQKLILAVIAFSGFISLSYEVLWSRVLIFVLTNATYSFSIMLAAFLCSIALGGLAGGRWADRTKHPDRLLGRIEIAAGLAAVFAILLLTRLPALQGMLFTPSPVTPWWYWNGIRFLQSFLVVSLAAFSLGATFPVAVSALAGAKNRLGTEVGEIYFYNTLGGVAGSLLTGFVLLPWLGAAAAMTLMISLNILLGGYLLLRHKIKHVLAWGLVAVLLVAASVSLTPASLFKKAYSISENDYPLVALREGIEGTVTVHRNARRETDERRIDVDGLNVAGSSFMLRTLQLLQGHLPLLMHPAPANVLQIGFGTGQTSWAALRHPIASFQLVEISPDVLQLSATHFRDLNHDVLQDSRFQSLILDGKNQIAFSGERYDVIMNDANYAVATASASLFTRDHFENGRKKLNPGGIFSTWMTTDLHPLDFQIVLKTFQSVFPHAVVWMAPNCVNKQVVLMGSAEPLAIEWSNWLERFPAAGPSLAAVNLGSPHDLLACLLLDEQGMARLCQGAEINTDNRPVLEFSTRDIRARDLCAFQNLSAMLNEPPDWRQYVHLPREHPELHAGMVKELETYYRASRQMFQGMLQFYQGQNKKALETILNSSRHIPESRLASGFYEEMDQQTLRLHQAVHQSPRAAGHRLALTRHYISLERYPEALAQLRLYSRLVPHNPAADYEYARIFLAQDKTDSARQSIDACLQRADRMPGAWFLAGQIAETEKDLKQAVLSYLRALSLDPGMHEAYTRLGRIHLQQRDYEAARRYFRQSLQAAPSQAAVTVDMADISLLVNDPEQAVYWYQRALILGETGPRIYRKLGDASFLIGQFANAVKFYRTALQQSPEDAELDYNLANALIRTQQDHEAVILYQRAIALNPEQADYYNNLAMLHKKMGDRSAALRVFAEGLRRHPNSDLMRENRETLLKEMNRRKP